MTAPPDDTTANLHAIIAALRQERDAGLAREATLAEELAARDAALAQRNSEYGERIEHQAATIEVLEAMSASPGDTQPIFDLIARQAVRLCNVQQAAVSILDGTMIHLVAQSGFDPAVAERIATFYPRPLGSDFTIGRAIINGRAEQVEDVTADPGHIFRRAHGAFSNVAVPMLRDGKALGAVTMGRWGAGRFSDSQVQLLRTFAEQAVIAISSAETYRALQTRTSDLQETLEYQTATSDVLKVISRSAFDLQPVLDTVVETAARLCDAEQGVIIRREGELMRLVANHGFPLEYEALARGRGAFPIDRAPRNVGPRAIREGRVVHVHDAAAEPGYTEAAITLGKQRTSLGVPLLREGEVIGSILLARQRVEPFTDRQIELVRTFADQAVIAMENARLLTEQREALEQQTATAEVLQVINASPGDLTPVFDAMLEKAMRLCGAAFGMLYTYDDGLFHTVAHRGVPAALAEYRVRHPPSARPGGSAAPLIEAKCPVHVLDMMEQEFYRDGDATNRATVDLGGARTTLTVPLLKDEALLGAITIYRQEVLAFSDKQIALLENFAAQAVIAMENARLITEQREALEQQTATAEVLQVINASPGSLSPVFTAILEKAMRLCEAAFGGLFTYDGERFHTVAGLGTPAALTEFRTKNPPSPLPGSTSARLLETRRTHHILDRAQEPDYLAGEPGARAMVELGGARSMLNVPLNKDDNLLGYISIYRQEVRPFSDKQIALLENFAAQAVIAMENARLLTEQREALEQQTATAAVLQVINVNPGNLAPVFEAILEKAHTICNFDMGSLATYDGTFFRAVATRGYDGQAEVMARTPYRPLTTQRALLRGDRLVHIPDMQAYPVDPDDMAIPAFVVASGFRAGLMVPLQKDGTLRGFLTGYRKVTGPFSEKQIVLLENFAAQAVIAMENARLMAEQREALEQQTATAEVLQVINTSPGNLVPVFDAMLQKATDLCAAAFGILWTFDGEHYHAVAFRNVPPAYSEFLRDPPPATPLTPLGRIAAGEAFAQIADMADGIYAAGGPMFHRAVELGGFRTIVGVALRRDAVLLGAITIYRQEVRPFSDKQIALLQNFATQAVVAMENARLLDEIRQRQEELRITFENMGDGAAMFDETHHLVAWNRKFQDILDVPDDIIARRQTYSEYVRYLAERGEFGPDPEEQVRQFVEQAGRSRNYERTRPDGRVIEVRHNPVPDGGFVLIFSDITERKRNEAQISAARDAAEEASRTIEAAYRDLKAAQANLIQAEKMASLGQLTAGIAHEIKNPLNFVNNFADLSVELLNEMKETVAPALHLLDADKRGEIGEAVAMVTANLEKISEHGKRADGIVKAMLEHSRGSSGERRMVDLNALIDEALNLAYHGARAQDQSFNITLERDYGAGITPIDINPQDITRVFLNLFSNGFYATTRRVREGGDEGFVPTLKVATRDLGDAVEIRVRDNGTGIPTDIRDKLFQPFFTTKPTGEGTGLGLSISYDIVTQQHGGSIAVDSKIGEYSEFTVRLPRDL